MLSKEHSTAKYQFILEHYLNGDINCVYMLSENSLLVISNLHIPGGSLWSLT